MDTISYGNCAFLLAVFGCWYVTCSLGAAEGNIKKRVKGDETVFSQYLGDYSSALSYAAIIITKFASYLWIGALE